MCMPCVHVAPKCVCHVHMWPRRVCHMYMQPIHVYAMCTYVSLACVCLVYVCELLQNCQPRIYLYVRSLGIVDDSAARVGRGGQHSPE